MVIKARCRLRVRHTWTLLRAADVLTCSRRTYTNPVGEILSLNTFSESSFTYFSSQNDKKAFTRNFADGLEPVSSSIFTCKKDISSWKTTHATRFPQQLYWSSQWCPLLLCQHPRRASQQIVQLHHWTAPDIHLICSAWSTGLVSDDYASIQALKCFAVNLQWLIKIDESMLSFKIKENGQKCMGDGLPTQQ